MTTDDHTTDEPQNAPPEPETGPTEQLPAGDKATSLRPRKLVRSRRNRMLAGVAGGLGDYFDVDPVIFRIGFGVSVFFGGLGVLAYLALALFLPDEEGQPILRISSRMGVLAAILVIGLVVVPAIGWGIFGDHGGAWGGLWLMVPVVIGLGAYAMLRDREEPITGGRVVIAILVMGAAVIGFIGLAALGALATALGHGVIAAAIVVAAGLVLVAGAFAGGWRWLIVPAIALATGVGVAAAADLEFDGGIGQRHYAPLTRQALPDDGYELAIGELDVDLRRLEWRNHDVVPLSVDLGVGEATIAVPSDVCVEASAHTGAGELQVLGDRTDGLDVDSDQGTGSTATPRLVLDANVDVGELRVVNDDTFDIGQRGHVDVPSGLAEANEAACA